MQRAIITANSQNAYHIKAQTTYNQTKNTLDNKIAQTGSNEQKHGKAAIKIESRQFALAICGREWMTDVNDGTMKASK